MPFQNIYKHDANQLLTSLTVLIQLTITKNMHLIPDTCYVIIYMLYEEKPYEFLKNTFIYYTYFWNALYLHNSSEVSMKAARSRQAMYIQAGITFYTIPF
jgi:hypothetical protein